MTRAAHIWAFVATASVSAVYYFVLAPPVLTWAVNFKASFLGMGTGLSLAFLWFAAEALLVAVPFVVLSLLLRRNARLAVLLAFAALATFWVPVLVSSGFQLAMGDSVQFSGIGGALHPGFALTASLVGTLVGLGVVFVVAGRSHLSSRVPAAEYSRGAADSSRRGGSNA